MKTDSMTNQGNRQCAECGYDLTGLAPRAACPECGGRRRCPAQEPTPRSMLVRFGVVIAAPPLIALMLALLLPRSMSILTVKIGWIVLSTVILLPMLALAHLVLVIATGRHLGGRLTARGFAAGVATIIVIFIVDIACFGALLSRLLQPY